MIKIANGVIAVIAGVGGAIALYWLLNFLVERLPSKWEERLKPYAFLLPALFVIGLFLIYPAIQTIQYSFADRRSTAYVGFLNYTELFSDPNFLETLQNNVLWILLVPVTTVVLGLLVATLADRLSPRNEKISKSVIFLPMAISMVGAAAIWGFVYAWRPEGRPQVGILNAIVTFFGANPISWLQLQTANINDMLLMVILVWLQAGFAMVLLSAALKAVPEETLEAARIDGASEVQIFFQVIVPQIWPTVVTVFVTIVILVMKIFDVVYVTTGGNFGTNVIALEFITQLIEFGNNGRAAATVVVLMIAVIPFMVYQVRQYRKQEA